MPIVPSDGVVASQPIPGLTGNLEDDNGNSKQMDPVAGVATVIGEYTQAVNSIANGAANLSGKAKLAADAVGMLTSIVYQIGGKGIDAKNAGTVITPGEACPP